MVELGGSMVGEDTEVVEDTVAVEDTGAVVEGTGGPEEGTGGLEEGTEDPEVTGVEVDTGGQEGMVVVEEVDTEWVEVVTGEVVGLTEVDMEDTRRGIYDVHIICAPCLTLSHDPCCGVRKEKSNLHYGDSWTIISETMHQSTCIVMLPSDK